MNVKTLILLAFLGLTTPLLAQPRVIKEANRAYRNENFCEAADKCIEAYKKLARKGTGKAALRAKADMAYKVARCYHETERFKDADEWYDRAINLDYAVIDPQVYIYHAEALRIMGDYKKATERYNGYKALVPGDSRADAGLESIKTHEEYKENRTTHVVTNISQLNTDVYDMAPMFVDKKDSKIAFSSNGGKQTVGNDTDPRTCQPYMDIYVSELDKKGNYQSPTLLQGDSINTEHNEGTVCIDARGKTMFFTRCPRKNKINLGCDIMMSEAGSKGWEKPVKLPLKPHDSISVGHPCVSEDGKYLIFASDMVAEGHQGGRDLWYTTFDKKKGTWTTPVNMGPEINTPGNDMFPSYAQNGDLIYASDGMAGMGGLDIFRAKKAGDFKWENPTNMGSPINSDWNDYALIEANPRKGYFTSERKGVKGTDFKPDLYMYELPPPTFDLRVIVTDRLHKETRLEGVKVTVTATGDKPDKFEAPSNESGMVTWDKKPNGDRYINEKTTYSIFIEKPGYKPFTQKIEFNTTGEEVSKSYVYELTLLEDKVLRLPEIRYPTGQWTFVVDETINSIDSLMFVYNLLTDNPELVIELSSHTDHRSGTIFNQVLSENRAKACYKFLVEEKGIDPRRIIPVGRGENQPARWDDPSTPEKEEILLTQAYIDKFKKSDPVKYQVLLQINRRTEGAFVSTDFNADTAPAADPNYKVFRTLPSPSR